MSEELRPCPFCKSDNTTLDYYEISGPQELGTIVVCNDCGASAKSIDDWNTRPIEDALNARIAARDALIERLVEVGNDIVEEAQVQEPDVQELRDNWRVLIAEWKASKDGGGE